MVQDPHSPPSPAETRKAQAGFSTVPFIFRMMIFVAGYGGQVRILLRPSKLEKHRRDFQLFLSFSG